MKKYIKASFDNPVPDWLKADSQALSALNRVGIDLKSMVVTDAPTGRGKDYPIYLIGTPYRPFVWIPGIYKDNETLKNPRTGGYEAIKYIPKKYLDVQDVIYVSKSDYQKAPKTKYKDPRYIYDHDGFSQYGGQYQYHKSFDSDELVWSNQGRRAKYGYQRDKSGYVIPRPDEMLKEFYLSDSYGASRLANRLEKVYNKLIELKSKLFDVDFTNFGVDFDGNPDYSSTAYQNMLSRFGDACRDYRIALKSAGDIDGLGREWSIENALSYAKSAESGIKRVESTLAKQNDW